MSFGKFGTKAEMKLENTLTWVAEGWRMRLPARYCGEHPGAWAADIDEPYIVINPWSETLICTIVVAAENQECLQHMEGRIY